MLVPIPNRQLRHGRRITPIQLRHEIYRGIQVHHPRLRRNEPLFRAAQLFSLLPFFIQSESEIWLLLRLYAALWFRSSWRVYRTHKQRRQLEEIENESHGSCRNLITESYEGKNQGGTRRKLKNLSKLNFVGASSRLKGLFPSKV